MMEDPDPYADLKQHRLTPEIQAMIDQRRAAFVPKKIQKRHQHFVQIPMWWVERLRGASGQTTKLLSTFCICTGGTKVRSSFRMECWRSTVLVAIPNGGL